MASFATVADVATELKRDLSAADSATAEQALELASADIQAFTRQELTLVTDDDVSFVGSWDCEFELPEHPVVDVTAVSVDGTVLVSTDYDVVKHKLVRRAGWGGTSVVVDVTYSHGFATIPDDIKSACLSLAVMRFNNPQSNIRSLSLTDYSVTFGASTEAVESVMLKLSRYRRQAL